MPHKFTYLRLPLAFGLLLAASVGVFADTIRLKDGSLIKGRITSFSGGKFVITIGDGTRRKNLSFVAAEVESIEFDSTATARTAPAVQPNLSQASYTPASPTIRQPAIKRPEPLIERPAETVRQPVPKAANLPVTRQPAAAAGTPRTLGQPAQLSLKVMADNTSNGWTNAGITVKRGQKIRISGEGEISLGKGRKASPSGDHEIEDAGKLLPAVPTGALIAVIGDDNNDFIYIGTEREFTASRDGSLFLGVNEGNLADNSGTFNVKVEVEP